MHGGCSPVVRDCNGDLGPIAVQFGVCPRHAPVVLDSGTERAVACRVLVMEIACRARRGECGICCPRLMEDMKAEVIVPKTYLE